MINKTMERALSSLIEAAKDVVAQYEQTHFPVGADLADSIRVFLKPALFKLEQLSAKRPTASVAAAGKKKKTLPRRAGSSRPQG